MVNPEDNTVEITVLDKDGNPLGGCHVLIKETGDDERTNSRGICEIKLKNSNPATLVISHKLYEDTKEIIVRSGSNPSVQLYRLKPVVPTSKELTFAFQGTDKKVKLYMDNQLIGETNFFKYVDTKLGVHELHLIWANMEWNGKINTTSQSYFVFEYKKTKGGFGYEYRIELAK